MIFKNLCILVFWMKVVSALEGFTSVNYNKTAFKMTENYTIAVFNLRIFSRCGQPGKNSRLSSQLSGRARAVGLCHESRRCEVPARGVRKFEI